MSHVDYVCNVCAAPCRSAVAELGRESPSCPVCGSTVRMRAISYLASVALFGVGVPLPAFPYRPDLRGVGLSDWWVYADQLADRIDYTNTYYHDEPRLDITSPGAEHRGRYDLLIATDVFEHVLPPVGLAFAGAFEILKPGGAFVFSVPWRADGETAEHYPDAVDYEVVSMGGHHEVDIITTGGTRRRVTDPVFHGGPGNTLELRRFSLPGVLAELGAAGFPTARVLRESVPAFGIQQPAGDGSLPLLARRPA